MKKLKISLLFSMLMLLFTNLVKADLIVAQPVSVTASIVRMDNGSSIGGTVIVNMLNRNSFGGMENFGSQTLYNGSSGSYVNYSYPTHFNITVNAMGRMLSSATYALPATTSSSAEIITFDLGTSSIIVSIYKSVSSPAQYVLSAVQGPPLH
jgi:hypothetical protein